MSNSSSKDLPFYLQKNSGFREAVSEDDFLHPRSFEDVPDDSATEAQYFGFSVPEAAVHGLGYMWHHPNLRVTSGGVFVCRGIKATTIHAELCDWRTYMSDVAIKNDLHEFSFDNSYGVKILEPMKRHRMSYADSARRQRIDLVFEAQLPPVMYANGNHFEQTMSVKGELELRGKTYMVDCFTVRDRSWGKPRQEITMPLAPNSWMSGTFNPSFSFNCTMLDQASNNPHPLAAKDEEALNCGWVYRDGKLGRLVKACKRVTRGPLLEAIYVDLQFTDDLDREFDIRGSLFASCPIQSYGNTWIRINGMRWECDGLVGQGDCQENFWNDFLQF